MRELLRLQFLRDLRLHTKFIALLISVSLLPLIVVAGATLLRYQQTLESDATALESQLAATAAAEIRTFIISQFGILENIAAIYNPDYPIQREEAERLMEITLLRSDNFMDISVVDATGREIARKDRVLTITKDDFRDRSDEAAFAAVKEQGIYVGPVYVQDGRPFFDIGQRITDARGAFAGAVFGQVDARVMPDVVTQISKIVEPPGRVYVVDDKGIVIAHPDLSYVLGERDLSSLPSVHSVVTSGGKSDATATYVNENGDSVLGSAHGMTIEVYNTSGAESISSIHWFVIAEQPTSAVFQGAQRALLFSGVLSFIAVLLAIAAAVYFAGRVSQPIEALHRAALEFGKGNLAYRARVESGDEIGDLAQSFNTTAQKLEQTVGSLKSAEQATAAERTKLQLILSSITNAVIAVDLDGALIHFNRAAEALTGYDTAAVVGKQLRGLISLSDKEKSADLAEYAVRKADGAKEPLSGRSNLKLVSQDGGEHFVNLSTDRIRDDAGKDIGCVLTFQDVTREFLMDRTKREFVSIAAHQLRTPLTGLSWTFESLLDNGPDALAESKKKTATAGLDTVHRMVDLVNDLLDVTQIEEGRFGINAIVQPLTPLLQSVTQAAQPQAKARQITLSLDAAADLPNLEMDAHKMEFVFGNLVDNAIKYTPAGGTVTVRAQKSDMGLLVEVSDTGIGIPASEFARVFSKFFRSGNAVSFHPDGSGLGLYVAKNIVEQHGGRIWFTSKEREGTTFHITLPLSIPKEKVMHNQPLANTKV